MPAKNTVNIEPTVQYGNCPSCGAQTSFDLVGIQHWPEKVAKSTGYPAIQKVWQCRNCNTTLMGSSLNLDSNPS